MKVTSKPFKKISRDYLITSKELKESLKIKGEIINIGLQEGISPKEREEGKSPNTDIWFIHTEEIYE